MHNPPMTCRRGLFLVVAAAAVMGCGGMKDDRPAKWSFIAPTIIEPSCATVNCHSAIGQRAGVDLHDRATGYQTLVGRNFAVPFNPDQSEVLFLMRAQGSERMPPDVPLPNADIDLIESWIMAGAMDN
jgi:hypothetical protein